MKYKDEWNINDLFILLTNRVDELNYILYSCKEDIFELNLSEGLYSFLLIKYVLGGCNESES